jgi:hypothetical protein
MHAVPPPHPPVTLVPTAAGAGTLASAGGTLVAIAKPPPYDGTFDEELVRVFRAMTEES